MKRSRWFRKSEDGYVFALSVIALPALLLVGLLVIDSARGNNAHSDLQAAADSVALTGARELNGKSDSIVRAKDAMARLINTVNLLSPSGDGTSIALQYADADDNEFTVIFLSDIPPSDATPIEPWISSNPEVIIGDEVTDDPGDAEYVYVRAQSQNLQAIFATVRESITGEVPIAATAVATLGPPVACNLTPIFICNPFEDPNNGGVTTSANNYNQTFGNDAAEAFENAFDAGALYGRLFRLYFSESGKAGPGNFGWIRVAGGSGAPVLADALAKGDSGTCFTVEGVDMEPGGKVGPVEEAIATHFGLYSNPLPNDRRIRAALNTRMGQNFDQPGKAECTSYDEADVSEAMALPDPDVFVDMGGGKWGPSQDWGAGMYEQYWSTIHGSASPPKFSELLDGNTDPTGLMDDDDQPSRYDVYRHEIQSELQSGKPKLVSDAAPNGETGRVPNGPGAPAQCPAGGNLSDLNPWNSDGTVKFPDLEPRRLIFSAIINCKEEEDCIQGAGEDCTAINFAKMFLTKPSVKELNERYLSLEVVDITGGSKGTLELVEESFLVR